MSLNLSGHQLDELKGLLHFSIRKITTQILQSPDQKVKDELKKKKEEMIGILSKLESESGKKAA